MRWEASAWQNGGGKCSYEYVGEHLQTSGSLLGSMSIAKLTSIRTVIRITCETLMANWLLWPWSRSPVVATWPKRTRVYFTGTNSTSRGEQSGFDAKKTQTKKKTTCNTSQLSKSIRSKESKIIQGVLFKPAIFGQWKDVTTPWRPPQWASRVPNPFCLCGFGTWNVGKASKSVGLIIIVIVPTDH